MASPPATIMSALLISCAAARARSVIARSSAASRRAASVAWALTTSVKSLVKPPTPPTLMTSNGSHSRANISRPRAPRTRNEANVTTNTAPPRANAWRARTPPSRRAHASASAAEPQPLSRADGRCDEPCPAPFDQSDQRDRDGPRVDENTRADLDPRDHQRDRQEPKGQAVQQRAEPAVDPSGRREPPPRI